MTAFLNKSELRNFLSFLIELAAWAYVVSVVGWCFGYEVHPLDCFGVSMFIYVLVRPRLWDKE